MSGEPDPCATCGAKAALRSTCPVCNEGVWVVEHVAGVDGKVHYKWGREVIQCRCCEPDSREIARRMAVKKQKRKFRDTGKLPGKRNPPICTPEMAKKAAQALARGLGPTPALREAGFPPSTVRAGRKRINRMIRAELKTLGRKYIEIGRDLSPEDQEMVVRGMLFENVVLKTDKGVMAAKQLGADKRVAMWQADSQIGLVVLQAPQFKTKMNHAVPILPPEPELEEGTE